MNFRENEYIILSRPHRGLGSFMGHNFKGLGHFINYRGGGGGARVKMSKQLGLSINV